MIKLLLSTFLFILLSSSWVYSDEFDSETKHIYHLKCFASNQDCTLFETKPQPQFEIELEDEPSSVGDNDGGKLIKRKTDIDSTNSKLQNLIKRFFNSGDKAHAYKADEVNCLTGDCKILTAKIAKRNRNGYGTLACVGDPYSGGGSRCLPLEGLYIGK